MKPTEVEFKYPATVSLTEFKNFADKRLPENYLEVSGYDHFYVQPGNKDSFFRFRKGPGRKELTFKRKTVPYNSYVRTEHNIRLGKTVGISEIAALLEDIGFNYNTSIFKSCFIYRYSQYTLSYYICYDVEMKELGRFIELEMAEDGSAPELAYSHLTVLEKLCRPIGALPANRVEKSLFELFRKNDL